MSGIMGSGVHDTLLSNTNGTPTSRLAKMTSPQVKLRDMVTANKVQLSPLPKSPATISSSPSSARDIAALQGHVIPSPNRYASPRQVRAETSVLRDQSREWVRRYRKQADQSDELIKGVKSGLEEWQGLLNARKDLANGCKGSVLACSQLIEKIRHIEQDTLSIEHADLMTEIEDKKGTLDRMVSELAELTKEELARGRTGVVDIFCWVLLVLFIIVHVGLAATVVADPYLGTASSNFIMTT